MTKLKEQASSDKQLVESMKMQIKELERTHSLECAKSLEKVKELQARISTHSLENFNLLEKVKELQSSIENLEQEKNVAEEKAIMIQDEKEKYEELFNQKKEVSSLEFVFL